MLVLSVLFLLSLSMPVRRALAERERVALELAPSVGDDGSERLSSAIAGQLSDLVSVERAAPDGAGSFLCRVRIDRTAQGLTVRFSGLSGGALPDTRVLGYASPELAATEVASVVRALVVALLERQERAAASSASPPQPAAPAPPIDAPEPPASEPRVASETPPEPVTALAAPRPTPGRALPSSGRVWLTALYSGNSYAPELPWQSGTRLEGALRVRSWLHAGLGYALHPAVAVPGALARLRVLDHGPSALAGVARAGPRLILAAELVVGLTKTYRQTTRVAGALSSTPDSQRWSTQLALRLRARVRAPFWTPLWLELAPALELSNTGASAVRFNTEQPVLSPRSLRFRLDVGASFDVL